MISLHLTPARDLRCPNCNRKYMFFDPEGFPGEGVVCGSCGWRTDVYEAWKADHKEEERYGLG